jgi:beta-glucanase (GH16 family)
MILKNITISALFIVIIGCTSASRKSENSGLEKSATGYELVWSDEFNYSGLPDSTKWGFATQGNEAGWGNNELQWYTEANEENTRVENNVLKITALRKDVEGKHFTSARLVSKADWKYGKFEIRAKLPEGRGTWPAIWMMPGGWSFNDGGWPGVGEIDIMEHVGYDFGVVHGTVHTEAYNHSIGTQVGKSLVVENVSTEFHVYAIDWTENEIIWYIDGEEYFRFDNQNKTYKEWPFDKSFHLIMNIAIGGNWGGQKGIDPNLTEATMEIDYVRVYKKHRQE